MKNYTLMLTGVVGALCLPACSTDTTDAARPQADQTERAFPHQTGTLKTSIHRGNSISYQLVNGTPVYQGGIILSPTDLTDPDHATDGAGRTLQSLRWTNKIVYYKIDPALPNQQRVFDAMNHWTANTKIRFVERTTQYCYVTFQDGGGGGSGYIGRVGGQQWINMGPGCTVGNVIHEIGHTVDLYHEHTRADRDQYVTVNTANAEAGHDYDFQTYTQMNTDGFDQAGGLDSGSVMMYNSWAFSATGQPTITKKDGSTFNAQRDGLSPLDIATVRTMYP